MTQVPPVSLSLVIPAYREQERLCAALQSLAAQDYPATSVQVIVVDDASPTFDPGLLQDAAGAFGLEVFRHDVNQGRARARNTGIRAASGAVVVFLDSDMTVAPGFLQAHAALHQACPGAVGIGDIRFGPEIPSSHLSRYIETRGVHKLKAGSPVPYKCFATGNSSVQREQLVRVGMFDEAFTAYGGEDLELGFRLHQDRASFFYLPQALSFHHHLRSLEQLCQLMYTYGQRSIPLMIERHPELAGLLRLDFLEESPRSLRRLFYRLALFPLLYRSAWLVARWGSGIWLPDILFDYLWWYNRTCGYLAAGITPRQGDIPKPERG